MPTQAETVAQTLARVAKAFGPGPALPPAVSLRSAAASWREMARAALVSGDKRRWNLFTAVCHPGPFTPSEPQRELAEYYRSLARKAIRKAGRIERRERQSQRKEAA